jgi:KDO2-lipid IV(A) lauroyltransferase
VARASVQTVTTRLTPQGYTVSVSEAWPDFPTADAVADTARMNRLLEGLIVDNVTQYLWTHRRFKTRPAGQASVYA